MNADALITLAAYSLAIVAASLLGGWLPAMVRMTHTRTQIIMSFVAGLMLGVALYHLLPHGILQLEAVQGTALAIDTAVWWAMLGMILMLLLLRLFHFHQHDFSHEEHDHHDHHHFDPPADGNDNSNAHPLSWIGIALGLGLHTLIDGVALGASIKAGLLQHDGAALVGLGVFLAILLHKPLDALSITSMMQAGGWGARARTMANIVFAMMCPLGALLFFWGVGSMGAMEAIVVGSALAFSAGVFLCISLGDLLPEVHFHSHDRFKLTFSFLVGIGLAYGLRFLEPGLLHHV